MRNPGHTSLGKVGRIMFYDNQHSLVAGTYTEVALPITGNSSIWTQRVTVGGTPGFLSYGTITPGDPGSVVINSDNALDTSAIRTFVLDGLSDSGSPESNGGAIGGATPGFQWGTATLVAGTVTIATKRIPSGAKVMAFAKTLGGGATGHLSARVLTYGNPGSFIIESSNAAADGVVQWAIVDPAAMASYQFLGKTEGSAAKAVQILSGSLVAGAVTLVGTFPTAALKTGIYIQRASVAGAAGHLTVGTVTAGDGGSVVVNSSNAGDTSPVNVFVFNHEAFGRVIA